MPQGFIQLHRKIQEEWFWRDPRLAHLMVTLILEANHQLQEVSFQGKKRTIRRGETIRTTRQLASITGIPKSSISRMLKRLCKENEIEILKTKASHIRILKYEYYLTDDFDENWDKDGAGMALNNNYNNENTTHTLTDFQSAKVSYEEMIEDEEFMNQIKKRFFFVTKNIDGEIYNMEAHYEEKGTPPRNWKAALKKWLSRLEKFKREDERKELAKANLES